MIKYWVLADILVEASSENIARSLVENLVLDSVDALECSVESVEESE